MKNQTYLQSMLSTSHISAGSAPYVDQLFESYLKDPNSVEPEWQEYFKQLPKVDGAQDISHAEIREKFLELGKRTYAPVMSGDVEQVHKQAAVTHLINAYRSHGHLQANLNPLDLTERPAVPDLSLIFHGLSEADYSRIFTTSVIPGSKEASLKDIFEALNKTYCGSIGVEHMHITDNEQRVWLQERLEKNTGRPTLNKEQKYTILKRLTAAEGLERYLGTKYVGQKRFSVEGGESLIPLLDELLNVAGEKQVKDMIIGMAHRGRLNVLVNSLGKEPNELFQEFEGNFKEALRSGDVKYHQGFSTDLKVNGHVVHLALAFNPSHLEIIAPVVQGSVRSRQRRRADKNREQAVAVIIHGDAALAGQGVVMETLTMSQARGFTTGGTLHIVINNQVGFTTSNPLDARSSLYCTDVMKMVQAPVFHVNGDDPEAVVFAARLAFEFRMKFKKDIMIDLVCYRRHGHNEADEPSATQPMMYQKVRAHPTTLKIYSDKLVSEAVVTQDEADGLINEYRDALDKGHSLVHTSVEAHHDEDAVDWEPFMGHDWRVKGDTKYPLTKLKKLAKQLEKLPKDFEMQAQVARIMKDRTSMTEGERPLNWGYAETLAYATLLKEGVPIRLTGQDCQRGTFAHRHAVLHDKNNGDLYTPLQDIAKDGKSELIIIDSLLSEEAVLGFEYGYATAEPNALVLWEAQFGDFANGAQVIIDQFISSGEQKWGRLCGLVMLLPHGYEGLGPEHSSARLERYLQLCAQHNMQVCVPTTPAQIYHLLRRQVLRPFRKPLIVMTPKSLLRHKMAVSTLDELAEGEYQLIIPEVEKLKDESVKRIILCCGKVYYDLVNARTENKKTDVVIIRVEQLYPFPEEELKKELQRYKNAEKVVWCQEEPRNQGAWYQIQHRIRACMVEGEELLYSGRKDSASPAVGDFATHAKQQQGLVKDAFDI